jgi:hypothetical protein
MEYRLSFCWPPGGGEKHHFSSLVLVVLCARVPMGDDDEVHLHVTYASHFDMDEAFCARMRMAIEAGLESAPIGVITTPGTKYPRYVLTEIRPR